MAGEIKSYRDLIAWQKAMELCKRVYALSVEFPDAERFGLTAQLRRAAVSVPSNIAEGYGRRRTNDYLRFLDVVHGSLYEVETQVFLARELGMVGHEQSSSCVELITELDRVLNGLARAVRGSTTRENEDGSAR